MKFSGRLALALMLVTVVVGAALAQGAAESASFAAPDSPQAPEIEATLEVTLEVTPEVINDNIDGATLLQPLSLSDSREIVGATLDPSDPALCTPVSTNVWWRVTPAYDVTIDANTLGSTVDTVLGVYHNVGGGSPTGLALESAFNPEVGISSNLPPTVWAHDPNSPATNFTFTTPPVISLDAVVSGCAVFITTVVDTAGSYRVEVYDDGVEIGRYFFDALPNEPISVAQPILKPADNAVPGIAAAVFVGNSTTAAAGIDPITYDDALGNVCMPNLEPVVCNDDSGAPGGTSAVSFQAAAGETYYFQIGEKAPAAPATPGDSVTINQDVWAAVAGVVGFQGRPPADNPRLVEPVHVRAAFYSIPSAIAYDGVISTDESGIFTVDPLRPNAAYIFWVKPTHALARVATFTVPGGISHAFGTFQEGDADENNAVTIADFAILAAAFGKSSADSGFDARADFNNDGAVTILDFSLLAASFGQTGAAIP